MKSKNKRMYTFSVQSYIEVCDFLISILPYLIIKKEKAIETIEKIIIVVNELDEQGFKILKKNMDCILERYRDKI